MNGRRPVPGKVIDGAFPGAPVELDCPKWRPSPDAEKWQTGAEAFAQAKWQQVTAHMQEAQTLAPSNEAMIEALCRVYARWKMAEAEIDRDGPIVTTGGTGVQMHNPYLTIANNALKQMVQLESELGISPTMRERVSKAAASKRRSLAADSYLTKRAG
jgi:P27 family predicted phage terminase small subunit